MFDKLLSFIFKSKTNKELEVAKNSSTQKANGPVVLSYPVNDKSTPSLIQNVTLPTMGVLKYNVIGYNQNPRNNNEKQALNCYINIGHCINYFQKNAKNLIRNWPVTSNLRVIPQAGKDLNAYYDRFSLKFFYYPTSSGKFYTADSSDIVSHELGHAILDAIRPDFWNVQSLEIWSFHEAFADICSLVGIMQHEVVLKKMLQETSNDISNNNVVSKLAESFGKLIYDMGGKDTGSLADCLRNPAIEKYKYVDPKTLPTDGRDDQLLAESHSFGRVFSAAWYQILIEIYNNELLRLKNPMLALISARDICFSTLLQAIPGSPRVSNYYNAIAISMVNVAKIKHPNYWQIINKVFIEWNIVSPSIKMLSNVTYNDLVCNLSLNDQVVRNSKYSTVRLVENKTIKLNSISIMSDNKLNDVEVEIPSDKFYEFDSNGNLVNEIIENEDDVLKSVEICIQNVEKSIENAWSVKDGKLIRNYIS